MYTNKHYNILIDNGFEVNPVPIYKEFGEPSDNIIGWYVSVKCRWMKYSVGATSLEEIYKHILEVFEID